MDWFIFCPIRGLHDTFPDDDKGFIKTIQSVRELAQEIKSEGYKYKDITIIRGERKELIPPGDYRMIDRKPN